MKIAKLKNNKGYIATFQGSPVCGTYSLDKKAIERWILLYNKLENIENEEKLAYSMLRSLPKGTNKNHIHIGSKK